MEETVLKLKKASEPPDILVGICMDSTNADRD